jgi:hypothetical protein
LALSATEKVKKSGFVDELYKRGLLPSHRPVGDLIHFCDYLSRFVGAMIL